MPLTETEKKLAAFMLNEADENTYRNRGCNDFDLAAHIPDIKERRDFVRESYDFNGDPEEFDPNDLELPDYAVMGLILHKIKQELGLPDLESP